MSTKAYFVSYVLTALIFLALDAIWLSFAATRLYRPLLGDLLQPQFNVVPAALFYVIYVAGIVVFATAPALQNGRWLTAAGHGAFLGFVAYATYDLTNQATLRQWPTTITVADMIWGMVATGTAAALSVLAMQRFMPPSS